MLLRAVLSHISHIFETRKTNQKSFVEICLLMFFNLSLSPYARIEMHAKYCKIAK